MRASLRGLVATLACLATVAPATAQAAARGRVPAGRVASGAMVRIPAGAYRPLYRTAGAPLVRVRTFALDRRPVTRGDYLRFVQAHPAWARGAVPASLAEPGYLADWPAAGSAGSTADLERPVTSVSWFAARAYCAALGKRLPTVDEWELAAAASETSRDATSDLAYRRRLAALYAARRPGPPPAVGRTIGNVYGVHDLHGLVWEWTSDFNATVSEHPAHAAHAAHAAGSPDHAGHPLYCASSAIGATDPTDYPAFARAAVRGGLTARSTVSGVGFRCAAAQPI